MEYKKIVELLKEFDYDKNTKQDTLYFLIYMAKEIMENETNNN